MSIGALYVLLAFAVLAVAAVCVISSLFFVASREFLKDYGSVFTLIFALSAAAYTLWEYENRREQARKAQTLDYIARLQFGSLAASRRWVDEFLIDNLTSDSPLRRSGAEEIEIDEALSALEELAINDPLMRRHVLDVFNYYADVSTCANHGVCDVETACRYFGKDIGNAHYIFSDFISEWREVSFERRFAAIEQFLGLCREGAG